MPVSVGHGQGRIDHYDDASFFDGAGDEGDGFVRQIGQRHRFGRIHQPADAAQFEQFIEQLLHLGRRLVDMQDVLLHPFGVAVQGVFFEQTEEAPDRDQRRFEVVADGVGEAFEFSVFGF